MLMGYANKVLLYPIVVANVVGRSYTRDGRVREGHELMI